MDVGSDESPDPRPERPQRGYAAAPGIERGNRTERPPLSSRDRLIERRLNQYSDRWIDPEPWQEGEAPGLGHPHQAVEVAASVIPCASSQRSASIAALQPSAAAVTAWRYRWSWTSPAMNTPSILEPVSSRTIR